MSSKLPRSSATFSTGCQHFQQPRISHFLRAQEAIQSARGFWEEICTGLVELVGGQLIIANQQTNVMRVGDAGIGTMTVSNATVQVGNISVARHDSSLGLPVLQLHGSIATNCQPAIVLTDAMLRGMQFSFSFESVNNLAYVLEYKTNLNQADWFPLRTNIGNGGVIFIQDPATTPSRFYQVRGE